MSVFTLPAPTQTVDYTTLHPAAQALFDQLMEQADNTANAVEYELCMKLLVALTGLRPRYNDLRKCACDCNCPTIFDADHRDAHIIEQTDGYNLGRLQCPACADDHRAPAE